MSHKSYNISSSELDDCTYIKKKWPNNVKHRIVMGQIEAGI